MISFGIMAYNEEANIGLLLNWLTLNHKTDEIIVVASGCTDRTVEICKKFKSVNTIEQIERKGKASAINLFLSQAHGDLICLLSADCIPDAYCVKLLKDNIGLNVGITSPRVITTGANGMCEEVWEVCHQLSLRKPKMGEMIMFRNIVKRINSNTSVDEAAIQGIILGYGYTARYVPNVKVYNKGCSTFSDLVKQRKRIYHGHLKLKEQGYAVSSMSYRDLAVASLHCVNRYLIPTIIMEIYVRFLALKDYKRNQQEETVWDRCSTTKRLV